MYDIHGKVIGDTAKLRERIRKEGGAVILKHAMAMGAVAYQVYPVGPPHNDGTPHTRDTFQILKGDKVIAQKGNFEHAGGEGYEFSPNLQNKLRFLARGASFYLEFGTVFMAPRPILRQLLKRARADIGRDLRRINLRTAKH